MPLPTYLKPPGEDKVHDDTCHLSILPCIRLRRYKKVGLSRETVPFSTGPNIYLHSPNKSAMPFKARFPDSSNGPSFSFS